MIEACDVVEICFVPHKHPSFPVGGLGFTSTHVEENGIKGRRDSHGAAFPPDRVTLSIVFIEN